ncbi:hypothetical protein EFL25_03805 [Enterococcus faecium]|nr:hypothetical protein [Enterococcus faecium]
MLETKRLFHNLFHKRCSKACICGNKSSQTKIGGAIFVWLFLLLDADQLFHNLLKLHIFP